MDQRLLEQIKDCRSLPSLPAVALRMLELTQTDETTAAQIAQEISKDPALASKLLRTVNSSFYGCSRSISSVENAVVILGMQSVRTLALGFSLVSSLSSQGSAGFDHMNYWRRSLYAATAARILATQVGAAHAEACFLSALLMDLGMLVLSHVLGQPYAELCGQVQNHSELPGIETQALGLSHQEVVAHLASHWQLPEVLGVPMAYHHHPQDVKDAYLRSLGQVVALAARCADIFVDPAPAWSIADVRRRCMELYQINEIRCDAMLSQIGMRTQELAPLFEIRLDCSADYSAILRKANEALLAATKVNGSEERGSERRRAPRIARDREVLILPCGDSGVGQLIPVQLRDVSARGMGFVHAQPMELGSQFIFRVPRKDASSITLLYTVVRCQATSDGQFAIGAELECALRDDLAPAGAMQAAHIRSAVLE